MTNELAHHRAIFLFHKALIGLERITPTGEGDALHFTIGKEAVR